MTREDTKWLLNRIQTLEEKNSPGWWPTHRNIWMGCYDVWFCEQDRIDAINIPKARMEEAKAAGLIKTRGKFNIPVWALTDLGKKLLKEIE